MHVFETEQFLPITIDKAWDFFSSPKNLAKITPPSMDFRILTQLEDNDIYEGMRISYRVKPMLGIPVKWETLISEVTAKTSFTDEQIKGPYKIWRHTHTFIPQENGVLMNDIVHYQLPLGWLGRLAEKLIVRGKIKSIFNYRTQVLNQIFT